MAPSLSKNEGWNFEFRWGETDYILTCQGLGPGLELDKQIISEMNNSSYYDSTFENVSGLPEMPSLVRIEKDAIQIRLMKRVEILEQVSAQMFDTGKRFNSV